MVSAAYSFVGGPFRARRMKRFVAAFGPTATTTIVDVGGAPRTWLDLPCRPRVTVVNLAPPAGPVPSWVRFDTGDATRLPYADGAFDIAFSNSVIEHVGDLAAQRRMAAELRRVAGCYYLQTPARSFPFEPHYLTPFVHWLPMSVRRRLLRNLSVWGWITRPSPDDVDHAVTSIRLLSLRELRELFPDATILRERVAWMTKSWTVVKARGAGAGSSPVCR